mgnify:CR=1 FL=1
MKLVFATNNAHKLDEIQAIVGHTWKIKGLKDIAFHGDIPEPHATLEENAMEKAKFVYKNYNCNCFADDTGLEVQSLDNEPGVHSARYAGDEKDSGANVAKLLHKLSGLKNRKARFRTVIALILEGREYIFEGMVNGRIIHERRGKKGFGYDPVFVPDGYQETFAEMPADEKNKISHRANAMKKLAGFLKEKSQEGK